MSLANNRLRVIKAMNNHSEEEAVKIMDDWLVVRYDKEYGIVTNIWQIDFPEAFESTAFFWHDYLPRQCEDLGINEDSLKLHFWQDRPEVPFKT